VRSGRAHKEGRAHFNLVGEGEEGRRLSDGVKGEETEHGELVGNDLGE
jgi:hypothetical protein